MISNISLKRIHLNRPRLSGQFTQISMIAGNANPNADRQKAPKREINRPSIGMVRARTTKQKNDINNIIIVHKRIQDIVKNIFSTTVKKTRHLCIIIKSQSMSFFDRSKIVVKKFPWML
jgi:histidinol phosphatase-like enzyme